MAALTPQKVVAIPVTYRRRCYGAAVEAALVHSSKPNGPPGAPRLQELLTQLDADGHDTVALREELGHLLDAVGMGLTAFAKWPPIGLWAEQIATDRE